MKLLLVNNLSVVIDLVIVMLTLIRIIIASFNDFIMIVSFENCGGYY